MISRGSKTVCAAALALAVFIAAPLLIYSQNEGLNPHAFDGECETRCHTLGQSNHPVGVRPKDKAAIPEDLHLDQKGNITCATCHDVHQQPDRESRYLLRRNAQGKVFCMTCHPNIGKVR